MSGTLNPTKFMIEPKFSIKILSEAIKMACYIQSNSLYTKN